MTRLIEKRHESGERVKGEGRASERSVIEQECERINIFFQGDGVFLCN